MIRGDWWIGLRHEQLKLGGSWVSAKARVSSRGAVLLGDTVACDAFDADRPVRVVTHAHADHLSGLRSSLRACSRVLMTPATRDLIGVMNGSDMLADNCVETVEYGRAVEHEGERVTLVKAAHILGAAQVVVEGADGGRVAYTGDFRLDGTEPVEDCDVLVVEATYGSPMCRRNFEVDVEELLVRMVEERLRRGAVYVFGYHGKLQEVMEILRDADVEVPFVMPERVYRVSKVCAAHGMRLGDLTLSTEGEGRELLEGDLPCVAFYHMNARGSVGLRSSRICVSGWEFHSPCRQIGDREHLVALSDHSDFDGLVEYVRRCKPRRVVTDNFRVSHGVALAREIRRRLGVPAVAMPARGDA
ncbi:MAG: MBL fold metallo-hydrolase [Candidatus Bathyarchaeota archaeon]|nr:MBL fold metallo-hydrolase [Candidatus Bathyarchaeota archaeon]